MWISEGENLFSKAVPFPLHHPFSLIRLLAWVRQRYGLGVGLSFLKKGLHSTISTAGYVSMLQYSICHCIQFCSLYSIPFFYFPFRQH